MSWPVAIAIFAVSMWVIATGRADRWGRKLGAALADRFERREGGER